MYRKTFYITEEQNRRLKKFAAEAGVSRNELIRRALDQYLHKASALGDRPDRKDRPAQS